MPVPAWGTEGWAIAMLRKDMHRGSPRSCVSEVAQELAFMLIIYYSR
jgi:hypothetical protein